jgi:hypothetical protein
MEVIGVLAKNLPRKPEFHENQLIEVCSLYKGVQKHLPET